MPAAQTTVVTALVDLGAREGSDRRDGQWYLTHCDGILSTQHALIVFAEPQLVDSLREIRNQLAPGAPSRIIGLPFERLPRARDAVAIQAAFDSGRRPPTASNPTKDTPSYIALGWSKPGLVGLVAQINPFNSSMIWWADVALLHVASPGEGDTFDGLIGGAQVGLHANVLWEIDPSEYEDAENFYRHTPFSKIAGGLFGIPAESSAEFTTAFNDEVDRCLGAGWPTIDEVLLGVVFDRLRNDTEFSYGPWETLLSNFSGLHGAAWHRLRLLRDCMHRNLLERAGAHINDLRGAHGFGRIQLTDNEIAELADLEDQWRRSTRNDPVADTSENSPDSIARQ